MEKEEAVGHQQVPLLFLPSWLDSCSTRHSLSESVSQWVKQIFTVFSLFPTLAKAQTMSSAVVCWSRRRRPKSLVIQASSRCNPSRHSLILQSQFVSWTLVLVMLLVVLLVLVVWRSFSARRQ